MTLSLCYQKLYNSALGPKFTAKLGSIFAANQHEWRAQRDLLLSAKGVGKVLAYKPCLATDCPPGWLAVESPSRDTLTVNHWVAGSSPAGGAI